MFLGSGNGTFAAKVDYATGATPCGVGLGDLDDDGDLDMAVGNYFGNSVSVFLGVGDGTFLPKVDYAAGTNPCAVAIADLDDDGDGDLAVANRNSSSVSVLLGSNIVPGTFGLKVDYTTSSSPFELVVGDLDDDGDQDLAVAARSARR